MKILPNNINVPVKGIFVLFAFIGLVSCQKSKDDNPQPVPPAPGIQAEGFWQGHYRFIGSITNYYMKVLVKPGGKARVYEMFEKTDTMDLAPSSKTDATWTMTNDKLEVTFVNDGPFLFSGTINPDNGKWTGSWKRNGDLKGTFSLFK